MRKLNIPSRLGRVLLFLTLLLMMVSAAWAAPGRSSDNSIESTPYTANDTTSAGQEKYELPSIGSYLFKMVLSLGVIAALAYGMMKIFPRKLSLLPAAEFISVYDQYALGPNKGIYIAEIGGQVVALGVTDHNITVLTEISDQDLIREMRENLVNNKNQNKWEDTKANLLQSIMGTSDSSTNKDMPFSSHMLKQISKLQAITQGKFKQTNGKDDTLD